MRTNLINLITVAISIVLFFPLGYEPRTIASEQSSSSAKQQEPVAVPIEANETPTERTTELQKGTPVIEFENPIHDFGKVKPTREYSCEFKFKNIGDGTLNIEKIKRTCGCTIAELKKKEYAPGESGSVVVKFHSPAHDGNTEKRLYIHSNCKKNPAFKLTIKAKVEINLIVKPMKLNLSLKKENAGITPITITDKNGNAFSVKSFTASHEVMTAEFDPSIKSAEFVLEPNVDIEKLKTQLNGRIKIGLTHPDSDYAYVIYTTKPLFEVSRSALIVRNIKPAELITKDVWVKSNYGDPIEIKSISSAKKYMKIVNQRRQGNSVRLIVQITPPPRTDKSMHFSDDLKIKLKTGDELAVRCCGFYTKSRLNTNNP